MPRYRLLQKTFIEPNLWPEGAVIDYDGPPGPHLQPLDEAGARALETYYRENPHASLNPVENLPKTMAGDRPTATLVAGPDLGAQPNLPSLGMQIRPTPGPTEGGKIAADLLSPPVPTSPPAGTQLPDNPAMGDPTKPGEKGAEKAEEAAAANAKATSVANLKVADKE